MSEPIFVVDYDESSVNSFDPFLRFFNGIYGTGFSRDQFSYGRWEDVMHISVDHILGVWADLLVSPEAKTIVPNTQAKEVIDVLSQYGRVVVLTDRPKESEKATFECVQRNFTPDGSTTCSISDVILSQKEGKEKIEILQQLGDVRAYFEDSTTHVYKANAAGIYTVMKNQIWNVQEDYPSTQRFEEWKNVPDNFGHLLYR